MLDTICLLLQKLQNSLELAEAIRELEASTAALTTAYDQPDGSNASRGSLQCSSGYGTMNSTPSGSEDTITTGGMSDTTYHQRAGVLSCVVA